MLDQPSYTWRVESAPAREAPGLARLHQTLVDHCIDRHPRHAACLYRAPAAWLAEVDATVFVVRDAADAVLATCNTHPGAKRTLEIGGLVKAAADVSGVAPRVAVAAAIDAAPLEAAAFVADSRVFPACRFRDARGRSLIENQPSLDLFGELGFRRGDVIRVEIAGNERDRHLIASSEDGPLPFFYTRVLHSTYLTRATAAVRLRDWLRGEH